MSVRQIRHAFTAALVATAFPGCTHTCTEMGCAGPTLLIREPSGASFGLGAYRVELFSADSPTPLRTASFFVDAGPHDEPLLATSDPGVSFSDSAASALVVQINAFPDQLRASVYRYDRLVGSASFTLVYSTDTPNGTDCPPTCRIAERQLEMQIDSSSPDAGSDAAPE